MKICVISFDFWGYDAHIVEVLKRRGIEANHLKIGAINHPNFWERLKNAVSKIILKRNLKDEKRQQFVIEQLKKLGKQNQILVLNPNVFKHKTLKFIKKSSETLITFLYDNLERYPIQDKLDFFDRIYSFDDNDIKEYGFKPLTNYNYLSFLPKEVQNPRYDALYITSFDKKRLKQLYILSKKFSDLQLKFNIWMLGKKAWKYQLRKLFLKSNILFRRKLIKHNDLVNYYKNTKAIIDLMRENQYGLSFRVFEAMALEKKIITDNEKIKNYDFYNPNNILVLNDDFSNLTKAFFETPYQSLPKEIYEKYTLEKWVDRVFNL